MKKKPVLNFNTFLDKAALYIAMTIEITVATITFIVISPDLITAIAMVAIGIIICVFSVRSWLKGGAFYNKILWAIFALCTFLFNWSFSLVATQTQSINASISVIPIEQKIENDTLIKLYNNSINTAQTQLSSYIQRRADLQDQFNSSVRSGTIDSTLRQQEALEESVNRVEATIAENTLKIAERTQQIINEDITGKGSETERVQISAQGLFYAIPNAINEKRWAELIIFFLIFLGLEITIIVSATDKKEKKDIKPKEVDNNIVKDYNFMQNKIEELETKLLQQPTEEQLKKLWEATYKNINENTKIKDMEPPEEKMHYQPIIAVSNPDVEIIKPVVEVTDVKTTLEQTKKIQEILDKKSTEEQIEDLAIKQEQKKVIHSAESEINNLLSKKPIVKTIQTTKKTV